jgi:cellulose 1,4-beta-cellobiosidase
MKRTVYGALLALAVLLCAGTVVAQQTSAPVVFTITAPVAVPTITVTAPKAISAGSPQFTITVTGTNFQPTSVVQWTPSATGSPTTALVTTFVSATQLTAVVPASLVSAQGTVNITVLNPIVVSQHNVGLSWVASGTTGATYTVKRGTASGGPYTVLASGIAGTQATDSTVANGQKYYYVVTAVANGAESVNSNEAVAAIPA